MKAILMAGGFGTRLRPLTVHLPKPMVPVANRPMMEHVVERLALAGWKEIAVMLYYQPDVIRAHFGDGKRWGVSLEYRTPPSDLGTAGCVAFALDDDTGVPEDDKTVLVMSADVLTDIDLAAAYEYHRSRRALATIVLTRVENPLQYGVVITDGSDGGSGRITRFLEKPSWGEVFSDTVNTGIYFLEKEALAAVPRERPYDFSKDLFPALLAGGKPIHGFVAAGYWKDVGDLDEYRRVNLDALAGRVKISGSRGDGRVLVGKGGRLGRDLRLDACVIGPGCEIGDGAELSGCVVWEGAKIGEEARIREAVIGRRVRIGPRASVETGAIISDDCAVGGEAIVRAHVKIWPKKSVEAGGILTTSLIWGERWHRGLFGANGITGLNNVEITPEFAARLGAAFGAFLVGARGKGAYVITSRDTHRASRMIKRSLISGLLSAGVRVGDLRTAPIPVVRYELGQEGESGGVHVRQSPFDPRLTDILFFQADGADLEPAQQRSIEQLFHREDFVRAEPEETGEILTPPRALEYYKSGFLSAVDAEAIRGAKFRVALDYANSPASLIFPQILGGFGCEVVSLNAFLHPGRISKTPAEFHASREQLAHIVTTVKAHAGFLLDNGAEKVFLIDEAGRAFSEAEALAAVALLTMKAAPEEAEGTIAVPVTATSAIETIAGNRFRVRRIATANRRLLAEARDLKPADPGDRRHVSVVGDGAGGFIFPEFQPAFDGMYAIAKILEMLARTGRTLSGLRREVPPFEVLHEKFPCAWEKKGAVMRRAIEASRSWPVDLLDGVKIRRPEGWVLLLPDPDAACFHLWLETADAAARDRLLAEYSQAFQAWQQ